MSELWHAGEQLRLTVAGHIIDVVPSLHSPAFVPGSVPTVNKGTHIIHTGLQYQAYLQLPIVPVGEKSR
jgi:predicted acyl esterase